jgi:hypothetical protein
MTATLARPRTSPAVRTGLVLAVLLAGGGGAAGIALVGDSTGTAVAMFGAVMALATLGALPQAWQGTAWALRTVAATRLLGALTAAPAFFVDDVPAGLVLVAAVTVVIAIIVAVLVLPRRTQA